MEGYCLKCRTKREIKGASSVTLKNGRPATQGTCPVCGTKITVIGKGVAK
jgi:RNase P subunit RPR2